MAVGGKNTSCFFSWRFIVSPQNHLPHSRIPSLSLSLSLYFASARSRSRGHYRSVSCSQSLARRFIRVSSFERKARTKPHRRADPARAPAFIPSLALSLSPSLSVSTLGCGAARAISRFLARNDSVRVGAAGFGARRRGRESRRGAGGARKR
jgi:hypothetical protein